VANIALGIGFQLLLARGLGLSYLADIYSLGTMVPTLVATVLIGSAPSVLVPAIVRESHGAERMHLRMLGGPTSLVAIVFALALALSLAAAPFLGRSLPPENLSEFKIFLLVSTLTIPLSWVVAVSQSALIAVGNFLAVGFSGAVNGLGLIIATVSVFAVNARPPGVHLAWAFVVGYVAQALVQFSLAFRYINWHVTGASEKLFGSIAVLLGSAMMYKSQPLIERALATYEPGGPAAFNYSAKISQAILVGSTMGLSLISLPSLSKSIAQGDHKVGWRAAQNTTTLIATFSAPLVATGIVAAPQIVALLFLGGQFTAGDVATVSAVLSVALVGVFFSSISGPTVNVLYAHRKYGFVGIVSVSTTLLGGALSFAFREPMGLPGIAVGTSIAFSINYVIFTVKGWQLSQGKVFEEGRRQVAVVVAVAVVAFVFTLLPLPHDGDVIGLVLRIGSLAVSTAVTSLVVFLLLRRPHESAIYCAR
jgi:putative peptidoglycan lipid II flippase